MKTLSLIALLIIIAVGLAYADSLGKTGALVAVAVLGIAAIIGWETERMNASHLRHALAHAPFPFPPGERKVSCSMYLRLHGLYCDTCKAQSRKKHRERECPLCIHLQAVEENARPEDITEGEEP